MNKRTRRKWLKKKGLYVNPKEIWNMNCNISKYILPRLKMYKKLTIAYPGYGEANTLEKWDELLDKMRSGHLSKLLIIMRYMSR